MKRFLVLLVLVVLTAGVLAIADEAVLIDFSTLNADITMSERTHNQATLIDYSDTAGTSYSSGEKAMMKTSLAIGNWNVNLASSSRTVLNQTYSFTQEALIRDDAEMFAGQRVLGVRVLFPTASHNSYAVIRPPFEIPSYMDVNELQNDDTLIVPEDEVGVGRKFDGYGVVKNVGVIRSIEITVRGLNFPHGISLVVKDENNEEQQIFMGYLNFDGWRTLRWENPNYITDVRNREIRKQPLYPKPTPLIKLAGIVLYRDAAMEGGDFITYIKDAKITFDKAVLNTEREIDDDLLWKIRSTRESTRTMFQLRKLGDIEVLRFLEKQKMHQEPKE